MQAIDTKTGVVHTINGYDEINCYLRQHSTYPSYCNNMVVIQNNFNLISAQNADLKTQIMAFNQQNEQLRAAIAQNNTQMAEMKTALAATSSRLDAFQEQMQTFSERISALMTAIPNAVRTMTQRLISVYAAIRAGALDALEFADDAQEIV